MADQQIQYAVAEGVATVTLNRPGRLNAWTPTMETEVRTAMTAASEDAGVRVIVLTGAGRGFCAGMDMQNLDQLAGPDAAATVERIRAGWSKGSARPGVRPDFQRTYSYFPGIGKPIIAAVNGPAVGLGLIVALYCDIRIASEAARFSTAFARRGLIAEHGLSWLLPRVVGLANACDLLLSARTVDAAEALRMGLVNRVLSPDQFAAGVGEYARELATAVSPRSLRVIKKQLYDGLFQTLAEAIDQADEEMFQSLRCGDFREGVAHFLAKRPPAFTGG